MERLFQLGGILLLIGAVLPIFLSQENFIYAAIFLHIFVAFQLNIFKEHIPTPLDITYFYYDPLNSIQSQSN